MWTVNRRLLSIVILALSACSTRCQDGGGGMHDGRLGEFAAVSTEVRLRPVDTLPKASSAIDRACVTKFEDRQLLLH